MGQQLLEKNIRPQKSIRPVGIGFTIHSEFSTQIFPTDTAPSRSSSLTSLHPAPSNRGAQKTH